MREATLAETPAASARGPETHFIRRLWCFLKEKIVQDVPAEYAACEFDCRVGECQMDQWETCENRLRGAGRKFTPGKPSRRAAD